MTIAGMTPDKLVRTHKVSLPAAPEGYDPATYWLCQFLATRPDLDPLVSFDPSVGAIMPSEVAQAWVDWLAELPDLFNETP